MTVNLRLVTALVTVILKLTYKVHYYSQRIAVFFFIDNISIPHSWYTVEENINDRIYIYLTPKQTDQDYSGVLYVSVKIDSGNYTGADLATELSSKIGLGVNSSARPTIFHVTFNARKKTNNINFIMNLNLKF